MQNTVTRSIFYGVLACICAYTSVFLQPTVAFALEDAIIVEEDMFIPEVIDASESATAEASLQQQARIEEKTDKDITQPTGKQKSKLESFLEENPIAPLSWYNGLQHAIRNAVSQGLPPNIVVLILLFPVIASLIAIARHIIGLQGFGIYTPAVLSVAFVSTGITVGLLLFLTILATTLLFKKINAYLRVQYLPRTAMLLLGVSVAILLLLIVASFFGPSLFATITIFPLLILILLSENFMETQLSSSQSQAIRLTFETVLVAVVCSLIISSESIQQFALLNPELIIIMVAAVNIIVGKYSGLRVLEYIRFKSIIEG